LPEKKGDPGRPIIPINIGCNHFPEVLCDFGASVNIMPKVLYEKIHGDPLLYTTMCLQMADYMLCYPKGILEDVYVRVGQSYVPANFMVIEIGGDERAPIILSAHSCAPPRPSSTPTMQRSVSTSRGERRCSPSESVHSKILHILRHCTIIRTMMELR